MTKQDAINTIREIVLRHGAALHAELATLGFERRDMDLGAYRNIGEVMEDIVRDSLHQKLSTLPARAA